MNSISVLTIAGALNSSSLLLVDSAIKGSALLLLAALAAQIMRRDSAASRHLVWLLAIVTMLVVPLLSAVLPGWRALPHWASVAPTDRLLTTTPRAVAIAHEDATDSQLPTQSTASEHRNAAVNETAAKLIGPAASSEMAPPAAVPIRSNGNWMNALPLLWVIGFCLLAVRLMAARLALWRSEYQATQTPRHPCDERLSTALHATQVQLGVRRSVALLLHPDRTIPVVWGIFRCRLLLPSAARDWSDEQLRSVLLHELAHIKRQDMASQLLAQMACALHWFNPLVWFAAWRLWVERERACDDLVLASGVRPSAYAGFLLEVVTALAPARWARTGGLAMARQSSLEGRLIAVLSNNLNRRRVSAMLAIIALAMAVAIVVPIAMLRAAEQKPEPANKPAATTMQTKDGLMWGKAVNGLQCAVAIRHSTDKPTSADQPDLYLAVKNVSKTPIRLSDADVPANARSRLLYLKIEGKVMWAIGAREPAWGNHTIEPDQVVYLPMFDTASKLSVPSDPTLDKHTLGSSMAEGALKDSSQMFYAGIEIEKAPAGAWTGKMKSGDTTGAVAAGRPQPKDRKAQMLLDLWQRDARLNGNIPGGMVGLLGGKVKEFIRNNTGDTWGGAHAKMMAPLLPRFDADHDWPVAQVVPLMDNVAAVSSIPLETASEQIQLNAMRTGEPLPQKFSDAPWGAAQANGLRVAWLLEPRAAKYRVGTPLTARILFHNSGKNTIVFRAWSLYQVAHTARDANGAQIQVDSTEWLTEARLNTYRLAPGEVVETRATGLGIGARREDADWSKARVGYWFDAKAGDDVTFTTAPLSLGGGPSWWLDFMKERISWEMPLPADQPERKRLLDRVSQDLFGAPPTAEQTAAFIADRDPDAAEKLARGLAQKPGVTAADGSLTSGPTRFHVLPPDPDAAKKPARAPAPADSPPPATPLQ